MSRSVLPYSATVEEGRLSVGGCRVSDLVHEHGTPLYVYDETTLRERVRLIKAAFPPATSRLSFAVKSCCTLGVLQIVVGEGLNLDVVSEGELEVALRAGASPEQILLHGNCKTNRELDMAVRLGLHAIVVDNSEEIARLDVICRNLALPARVMIRVALPVEIDTHPAIHTSGQRSKFGFLRGAVEESEAVQRLAGHDWLRLVGLHTHLGSQIADGAVFRDAGAALLALTASLKIAGFPIEEISVGGGWAVPYGPGDPELTPQQVREVLEDVLAPLTEIRCAVEPGRAIVAQAGVAIYRVGAVKTRNDRRIVIVDGGMGDNPRPALYDARYTALAADHMDAPSAGQVDVVGRYCESGDVLARDVTLPEVHAGDLIAIPVSGAYHLSMASAYNLVPQPAVVLVREGRCWLLTLRATTKDLLMRDIPLDDSRVEKRIESSLDVS